MKCSEPNCTTDVYDNAPSKGLCRRHYRCLIKNGTTKSKYDLDSYADLGGVRDVGKGRRGSLAVNVVNDIKYKATKRKKKWELTHQQAFDLITFECSYCGFMPNWPENRVGIDRIDSSVGYIPDNCVPCCSKCNSSKSDMSYEDFRQHVKKMYRQLFPTV